MADFHSQVQVSKIESIANDPGNQQQLCNMLLDLTKEVTVRLTSIGNPVPRNQEFCLAPIKTMVEQGKNKKSHSEHGLRMMISRDMFGLRLLNKKHLWLTKCHFSLKYFCNFLI
jgi:hypothetical protein